MFRWLLSIALIAMMAAAQASPSEDAVVVATRFLDQLDKDEFNNATGQMTAEAQAAITSQQLQQIWESLPKQLGRFTERGEPIVEESDDLTLVIVPLRYQLATVEAAIAINATGRIAGFHLRPSSVKNQTHQPAESGSKTGSVDAYVETEVLVGNPGKSLPGTLTIPIARTASRRAAVVIIHGSGPLDRDGSVGASAPYKDIARGLAKKGIISLRFDKRSLVRPEEFQGKEFTVNDEVVDDAIEAVQLLKRTDGIDPSQVYIFGHSLGGFVAPLIASEARNIAGLILFAAPARSPLTLLQEQSAYLAELDGTVDEQERKKLQELASTVSAIRSPTPDKAALPALLGVPVSYWRSLEEIDPLELTASLALRVLVLHGQRDYQVGRPDWSLWEEGLKGSPHVQFKRYPDLNHLGITGTGRSSPAEYLKEGAVDTRLISDIAKWICTTSSCMP